ncbi:unnamed protein product [Gongylonema pulchrum]|uniref:EGF-like domain-containing protein n=1 Tax=Gongylonema pulchrum TaxID=637853 RepID=A0A183ETC6_9BILA|nr:unnamed protein product [Gongylonema pulchrum]
MNPCRYGGCAIETFPTAPLLKYLKCNCVLQYTGEYCTELVDGAVGREIVRFSPFIAHICSTVCIFIIFFCCRRAVYVIFTYFTSSTKKCSKKANIVHMH